MSHYHEVNYARAQMPASIRPLAPRPIVGAQVNNVKPDRFSLLQDGSVRSKDNKSIFFYPNYKRLGDLTLSAILSDGQLARNPHFQLRSYEFAYRLLHNKQCYPRFEELIAENTDIESQIVDQRDAKERNHIPVLSSTAFVKWPADIVGPQPQNPTHEQQKKASRAIGSRIAVIGVIQATDGLGSPTGLTTAQRNGPVSYTNFGASTLFEGDLVRAVVPTTSEIDASAVSRDIKEAQRPILFPERVNWRNHDSMDTALLDALVKTFGRLLDVTGGGAAHIIDPARPFTTANLAADRHHFNEYEFLLLQKFCSAREFLVKLRAFDGAAAEVVATQTYSEFYDRVLSPLNHAAKAPSNAARAVLAEWTAMILAERRIIDQHDSSIIGRVLHTMRRGEEGMLMLDI